MYLFELPNVEFRCKSVPSAKHVFHNKSLYLSSVIFFTYIINKSNIFNIFSFKSVFLILKAL